MDRHNGEDSVRLLVGGNVFDGVSDSTRADLGILIRNGAIASVANVDDLLAGVQRDSVDVVDLAGGYVMPGLVNNHVHLGLELPGPISESFEHADNAHLAWHMAGEARRTVMCGVTTVRLVGERRHVEFGVRDAIENGIVLGPRIFTAGEFLCCTGGHGHESGCTADGVAGFRRATRHQISAGADFIKVMISGGMAGEHEQASTPQLTDDEMAAVIEIAHAWGRRVTAHAGPADVISRAVELGLDCVEHGYELDPATCELMVRKDVWYVPTIGVSRCKEFFDRLQVPEWMSERALSAGPRHWESLEMAVRAGVKMMMGTDMPPHAELDGTTATVREMELMQEAGLAPVEVLKAATSGPAQWLGASEEIGTIAEGRRADLLVLDQDPTKNVSALRDMRSVVKDGELVRGALN